MKYVKFTYIDSVTGVPCTVAPAANGPIIPEWIDVKFMLESKYPTPIPWGYGVIQDTWRGQRFEEVTEEEFEAAQIQEGLDRIALAKAKLRAAVNDLRNHAETQGFLYNGVKFDSDAQSMVRLAAASAQAQTQIWAKDTNTKSWTAADGTDVELTPKQIVALHGAYGEFLDKLHLCSKTIKATIDAAETLSNMDIEAIANEFNSIT